MEHWPYTMIGPRDKYQVSFYYTHEVTDNGAFGDPSTTSKELGKEICDKAIERLIVFIHDFVKNV